jgi:hypothetical protein
MMGTNPNAKEQRDIDLHLFMSLVSCRAFCVQPTAPYNIAQVLSILLLYILLLLPSSNIVTRADLFLCKFYFGG